MPCAEAPSGRPVARNPDARPPSEPRLGRAHQDPTALLAAQHLIGRGCGDPVELDLVELELASSTAATREGRGADPARGTDLVVEADELIADLAEQAGARPSRAVIRSPNSARPRSSSRTSDCAASERSMISSSTSSRSLWRRASDSSSCWIAVSSLLVPVPASNRARSRAARSRTCCTSASARAISRAMSSTSVRARTSWSSSSPALCWRSAISASSGRWLRAWAIWLRRVSMACRSSRRSWRSGAAFTAYLRGTMVESGPP